MERREGGGHAPLHVVDPCVHVPRRASRDPRLRGGGGYGVADGSGTKYMELLGEEESSLGVGRDGVVHLAEQGRHLLAARRRQLLSRRRVALMECMREESQHSLTHSHRL